MFKQFTAALARLIGLEANKTGHAEKLVSALGGLCGVLAVAYLARALHGEQQSVLIVASMGASAILVFAVPHGPLSQPWPVLGGHLIAAAIGITCAKLIPDQILAGAFAVGMTIGAMQYLRCMHPPGGGTTLAMVVGWNSIESAGYHYLLDPLLLDVVLLIGAAVVFNSLFPWRRYPVGLARYLSARRAPPTSVSASPAETGPLARGHLETALKTLNTTLDISEEDLEEIYRLAYQNQQSSHLRPEDIGLGRYYSNDSHDDRWQIRQVVDMPSAESADDLLIYKVLAGSERRSSGTVSRAEFARWAHHEVFLNENSWQRVESPPSSAPPG